jgi:hypothetical protein
MAITDATRLIIFNKLKTQLNKIAPPMVAKCDDAAMVYEIMGNKPVPYGYDKKIVPGMYFASIAQRKDSVAFYFFPAYLNEGMQAHAPSLFKCLKGKTCFHFKKEEQVDENELANLLDAGLQAWIKLGYMN